MTRPITYLIRMLVFLVATVAAIAVLSPTLWDIFWNNAELNGLILLVLAIGIGWNLYQVLRLAPEVNWLERYQVGMHRRAGAPVPRLLAPMVRMLSARSEDTGASNPRRLTLSASAFAGGGAAVAAETTAAEVATVDCSVAGGGFVVSAPC